MLKGVIILILLVGFCKGGDVSPKKEGTPQVKDVCKEPCPSQPHFSKCEYNCKEKVLSCKDQGFSLLSQIELEKWEKPLNTCKIEITTLRLESNAIERLTQIPKLPGLQTLNLRDNKMSEIEPKAFFNLPDLTELDLSQNILTGEAVRADIFIGKSKTEQYEPLAIQVLDLSSNRIHSLDFKTFEHLPDLRVLYLHGNPLKVVDEHTITAISSVPHLEVLSLSDCMLSKVVFPEKSTLKKLFLNNNNFSTVPQQLPVNLTYLDINGNALSKLPTCAFCKVPNLQELYVSGMPNLSAIESEAFRGLPDLKKLTCQNNPKLEDIHPAAFIATGHNWTLATVSFANCSLKSLPRALLAWSQVGTLDLRGNPLSCDEDDWSPDAVKLLKKSETAFGLLTVQQSCNGWNLQASRHSPSIGMVVQTLLIAVSAAVAVVLALVLVVLTVKKAQAEMNSSPHLMVHYRRATTRTPSYP